MLRSEHILKGLGNQYYRATYKSMGFTTEDLKRPLIGIANAWSECVPGHYNLRQVAQRVKDGIYRAGGTPIEFGVIGGCDGMGQGHDGMHFIMPSRELIANSIESMAQINLFDGLVLLGSCDKIVPGMLMAAARLDIPCIFLPGGPMEGGVEFDGRQADQTSATEAYGMLSAGKITEAEYVALEDTACPGCGSCSYLGTANTMCALAEALGMTLPDGGTAPATSAVRMMKAEETGVKIMELVEKNIVDGWDDPRMPTLCGLRRRGYTPTSIRNFCDRIGVAKSANVVEYGFLEHCLREDLNETAQRVMAVLRPIKLTITNYPAGKTETVTVENNPVDPTAGERQVPFSRHLYIEADDFLETPIPKYKRLTPGGQECRLKGAYLIRCTGCVKNEAGEVVEVLCEYDPESKGGNPADGRKVKGATIHWVDAATAADAEVRLYDYLFTDPAPDAADKNFLDYLNPDSLQILIGCKVELGLAQAAMPE